MYFSYLFNQYFYIIPVVCLFSLNSPAIHTFISETEKWRLIYAIVLTSLPKENIYMLVDW